MQLVFSLKYYSHHQESHYRFYRSNGRPNLKVEWSTLEIQGRKLSHSTRPYSHIGEMQAIYN